MPKLERTTPICRWPRIWWTLSLPVTMTISWRHWPNWSETFSSRIAISKPISNSTRAQCVSRLISNFWRHTNQWAFFILFYKFFSFLGRVESDGRCFWCFQGVYGAAIVHVHLLGRTHVPNWRLQGSGGDGPNRPEESAVQEAITVIQSWLFINWIFQFQRWGHPAEQSAEAFSSD